MAEGGGHVHVKIADELLPWRNKRYPTIAEESLPCIVRVPQVLKKLKPQDYVPEMVGLGPYHHHFESNFNLRSHKLKALHSALGRSLDYQLLAATDENFKDLLQQLHGFVSSFESKIKECYSEDFEFDADVFILDAVFLLELCFSYSKGNKSDRLHPLLDYRTFHTCVGISVQRDLFKLENQIPLPLLLELITWKGMFLLPQDNPCDFNFSAMVGLFPIKGGIKYLREMMKDETRPKHFIECLRRCIVKSMRNEHELDSPTRSSSSRFWKPCGEICSSWFISLASIGRRICLGKYKQGDYDRIIPTAKELERVGIVLQVPDDNKLCFKQGRFRLRGHLHLPKLLLGDSSEVMLRNMMAYEECCVNPRQRFFNRYMALMTNLIQTNDDADLLIKQGIIRNLLENSESVAHLFNRLSMFMTMNRISEIDNDIVIKVRSYYRSSARVMLREFMKTHFANPWYACATIAAVVVLVCTVVQAIYAVKSA